MNETEPESLMQYIFELVHGLLDEAESSKFKINKRDFIDMENKEEEECLRNV